LLELIERIANLLRAEERAAGALAGLPPVQVQALAYLARANRYSDTPQAVTEYLGITKGTVSQSLMRLREKGYLRERRDSSDARILHLTPSAKGLRLLESLRSIPILDEARSQMPKHSGLEQGLEELLRGMQTARGGQAFGVCRGCTHFRQHGASAQCGLTGEPLEPIETQLLCREFE
jgi:DNA-binding MarR family transcriptional regulator